MTKTEIMPGPCGFVAKVTAEKTGVRKRGSEEVALKVETACPAIQKLAARIGEKVDPMRTCLVKPNQSPFGDEAKTECNVHAECPVITGIIRTMTVEAGLALKKDVSIKFIEE